ncbi:barstar family protein [Rhodococcus sp. CX]|uniref:barstar family protein n=1 Tax=Rhodococcus sp. CX TaxID=2789880 RepID=UPI0018CF77C7|nr:barstar family protein [Rhodococcus sp. CX]MBH0122183.1 barstar family protein [Rhodococcus sp. CX]
MRADLTLLETTRSGAADLEEQLRQDGRVVHLRGRKMTTLRQLFDEFAAALQFPYYFGANKDAFDECLSEVCEAAAPSVLVFDAHELLTGEPDQMAWFVAVLGQIPLRVILQVPPQHADAVAERFAAAGHGDLGRSAEPGA